MRIRLPILFALLLSGGLAVPASAQNLGDLDGDGVPNPQDRCANTPPGTRVDANGCPVAAAKPSRPTPTLVRPVAPAQAPAAAPGTPPAAGLVTPQAAGGGAPPPAAGAFTVGLAMPAFSGGDALSYARTLARNLDSAIITLVGLFRNTSGQPMAGATSPASLSTRERGRWERCRAIHWDLTTYAAAIRGVRSALPVDAALARAAAALDTALSALDATAECDNVSSMMSAPERWDPWAQQYTTAARAFYAGWYAQVREVHEHDRTLVVALNAVLPAAQRLQVPPGLPRNAPYAGAAIR